MADENIGRADAAQPELPRPEAEIDILQIAAMKTFRKGAGELQASARDIEAESDAVRHVDDAAAIDRGGDPVDGFDILGGSERVHVVGDRETHEIAVIRQWRHRPDVGRGMGRTGEPPEKTRRHDRIRIQQHDIAVLDASERAIDGADESQVLPVGQHLDRRHGP